MLTTETADVDGDGNQDLISISEPSGSSDSALLSIGFGDGNGGIRSRVDYPISAAEVLAVEDLDADGDIDIAINQNRTQVAVFLNQGGGSFAMDPTFVGDASFALRSLRAADMNNDGSVDLAAASSAGTRIFYNIGFGQFTPDSEILPAATGNGLAPQSIADWNGDGILDIASPQQNRFSVLLGDPDGGFQATPTNYSTSADYIGTGDVDADGDLDLFASVRHTLAFFSVWKNDGAANFTLDDSHFVDGIARSARSRNFRPKQRWARRCRCWW